MEVGKFIELKDKKIQNLKCNMITVLNQLPDYIDKDFVKCEKNDCNNKYFGIYFDDGRWYLICPKCEEKYILNPEDYKGGEK